MTTYLLATDSVHTTAAACDYLASRVTSADTVLVVSVIEAGTDPRDAGDATNVAGTRLVEPTIETITGDGHAADVIASHAGERDVDEVIVGTHSGVPGETAGLGGTTADLLVRLDVPVVVVPIPDLE